MSEQTKPAKAMPKGGRKGGATFPRMNLETAVAYARRLVSKTHTGPQSKDVIYSGVLNAASSKGAVKLSALKQYGFVDGDSDNGFSASEHAKQLVAAPPEEINQHYRLAALRPKIFKALFETFHGDSVSRGKLKQRVAALKVHPDETEACIDTYLQSAQLGRLVTADGDSFRHVADSDVLTSVPTREDANGQNGQLENEQDEAPAASESQPESTRTDESSQANGQVGESDRSEGRSTPRAIFNVNVTLDSSLDTEKLQKQLELLKKFGAI